MGWFLDGRVTAVVGTHTHVQTADERVLPGGTAYITDVGMTGPHDGVIGVEKAPVIQEFPSGMPVRFEAASGDPILHGVRRHGGRRERQGDRHHASQPDPRRTGRASPPICLTSEKAAPDEADVVPLRSAASTKSGPFPEPRRQPARGHTLTASRRAARRTSAVSSKRASPMSMSRASSTNCRLWHTGHIYFTLKDASSQIKGVMFRSAARAT